MTDTGQNNNFNVKIDFQNIDTKQELSQSIDNSMSNQYSTQY